MAKDSFKQTSRTLKKSARAVEQVMEILLGDDNYDDVPDALVKRAVKEGLAKRFSFHVAFAIAGGEDLGVDAKYIAIIYPTEHTQKAFKSPHNCVEPLVPGAIPVDGCHETLWHFPRTDGTPAGIAKFLAGQGLNWNETLQKKDAQEEAEMRDVYFEIKAALEEKNEPRQKQTPLFSPRLPRG